MIIMDDDMEMDYMERSRLRRQRISAAIKSAVTFLFSHVGLAAMVIGYSIMGGFLFQAIEAPNEMKEKLRIRSYKEGKIVEIRQLADLMCIRSISADNFTDMVNAIQLQFQQQVTHAVKNNGWDGKDETDEATTQWSFAGSLLYAVTVITTIGYGHVAPKTTSGRLVTILYALIGIPLTFLYLSNMGNFMAECFRLFYKKVCCGLCIFCINSQPLDEEYERMEMAVQNNYAFLDADDDGKMATVYRDVHGMLRSNSRTLVSSSHEGGKPALQEGRRESRVDWERHSISKSLREDEQDRNETAALDAFPRESKYRETQFTTKMANDRGRGSAVVTRECDVSQGTRSAEMETRYSKTTGEEMASQKDDKGILQKKVSIDLGKVDRFSCNKIGEGIKGSGRNESCGRKYDQNKERLFSLDERRLMKRRHSFESGIGVASAAVWPLMSDKSVEVSEAQFRNLEPRCGRDPDGLGATSSSFSPLFGDNRSSERVEIKGSPGESEVQPPTYSKYRSSISDISPNSNATETSISENKDCIPLRRLPSRTRALGSISQQRLNAQTNEASWAPNGLPPADGSKCTKEGQTRNDTDEDEEEQEEEEQQRVIFARMIARRNRLSRSEAMIDDSEVSVPISVCLIIIGLYIFGGSMLFTLWEDWDYLTGSYFCFVTLSTIGFGDIVPGTDMKEWAAHQKLVLCSLWLVVGLSLLAMCFNLMQEEVKDRCKWLGLKLGILKDE